VKYKLVIADSEEQYVNGLISYVLTQKDLPIEVFGFSDKVIFLDYVKYNQNDILLVCTEFLDETIMSKNIINLSRGNVQKEYSNYPYVFKYSRLQDIWRQILKIISDSDILLSKKCLYHTKVLGIYSPVGQVGKTALSIAMAEEISKEAKVLLINLEKYSSLENFMGTEIDSDLGELLLYAKQKYANLALKVELIKKHKSNFDFLPTVFHNEDLLDTSLEDWQFIIDQIIEKLDYKYIIFDIGENTHLFKLCNTIIVPISLSVTSLTKFRKWMVENQEKRLSQEKNLITIVTGFKEGNTMPCDIPGCINMPYLQCQATYPSELQDLIGRCRL
jgi:hypothetical protein